MHRPYNSTPFRLADYGYTEQEFIVSGTATHPRPVVFQPPQSSGSGPATYAVRVVVIRPSSSKDFNGTLVTEWTNVTEQSDLYVDWMWAYPALLRGGFAYAAISVQKVGIDAAKRWDPERYAALSHPGDTYADDIWSQAIKGLRTHAGADPLRGLGVRRVLGMGQSQSAIYLHRYVDEVQASTKVLDGFLVDADIGADPSFRSPSVPVVHVHSEDSAVPVRTTAARNYRLWQAAGTGHTDYWSSTLTQEYSDRNDGAALLSRAEQRTIEGRAGDIGTSSNPDQPLCYLGGSRGPRRYVLDAAITGLDRWVRSGRPLPAAPPLKITPAPTGNPAVALAPGTPAMVLDPFLAGVIQRDADGNALGGYRLPVLDVPVAMYDGRSCGLAGFTLPMSEAQLSQRYPTHADYVGKVRRATEVAVRAGYLTAEDGADLLNRTTASAIPRRS